MRPSALAIVFAALLGASAARAETLTQTVYAKANQPAPLIVETAVRPDCSVGGVPESRVVVEPAHGTLSVREGRLQRQGARCPPGIGYVVIYVSEPNFSGHDVVTLEVSDGDQVTLRVFDINVGPELESDTTRG